MEDRSIRYKTLLAPYRLTEQITLKNRLTFANGQHGLTQGPERYPSEAMLTELADVCSSGAALICFSHYDGKHGGGANARRNMSENMDKSHIPLMDFDDPAVQNYVCQIPALAHMHGSRVLVRMGPAWPSGTSYGGGDARSLLPVSPDSDFVLPPVPRKPLTMAEMKARICPKEKIPEVIQELVDIAKKYKRWGFDGMDFRGDRFLDADTNLREDEYGGEVENRGRFLLELFTAVKKEVGEDFLIELAMPGRQDRGAEYELLHGYTQEEFIRFAKMVEKVVDIFQVREETGPGYHPTGYCARPHEHPCLEVCRALKAAGVKKTISANGGFLIPEDMEAALANGDCDLIATARAFIAEPEFVRKLCGDAGNPTPCIQCNKCHGLNAPPWIPMCSVNPATSMRHRLPGILKPTLRPKKAAVIGGGPIGMRVACRAAELGHSVTLYEKTDYLGGKLKHAELYSFKWPLKRYRDWLTEELTRLGVSVKLNCAPTPQALKAEGFDAVIACTGSLAQRPPVEGADAPGVWTCDDIYGGRAIIGQKVVVSGGGEVATETAMYLAELGKDVTILTRGDMLMKKQLRPHGVHWQYPHIDPNLGYGGSSPAWCKYDNLTPVYSAQTLSVTPKSVTYVRNGEEQTLECDTVVVSGGYAPCTEEALRYVGCAPVFYMAGDVNGAICANLQQGNVNALGIASAL